MHRQRNIYQSRTLDLLRNCLSDQQYGGCKQRGQTATIWLKALLMPRLAVCSRDLHWYWINWTLLCDTMEVSMLRLACLPIAQHVFQPALIGRLELISRKIVSSEQEQRLSRWADFAKNCLPRIECKELPWFREKYRALGRHVCKIREIGGQKNGVQHATAIYPIPQYTRPRYIGLTLYFLERTHQILTPSNVSAARCHLLVPETPFSAKYLATRGPKMRLGTQQGKSQGFDSCDRPSSLTQIGLKSSIFCPCDFEIGWMTRKIIRYVFYTTSSFLYHLISTSEFKLELQSGNAQSGSN